MQLVYSIILQTRALFEKASLAQIQTSINLFLFNQLLTTATGGGYNGTITLPVVTYECAKCHTLSLSPEYKNVLCNISQEFQSSLC